MTSAEWSVITWWLKKFRYYPVIAITHNNVEKTGVLTGVSKEGIWLDKGTLINPFVRRTSIKHIRLKDKAVVSKEAFDGIIRKVDEYYLKANRNLEQSGNDYHRGFSDGWAKGNKNAAAALRDILADFMDIKG